MENFSAASFETIINILDSKGKRKSIHCSKDYLEISIFNIFV
ncbi:hypothetical protein LEP1GSC188_0748 [Leptospira weilii serovar Topaz str. LT2116]|uniref:Uncharacterized protein n=1 Tax=Leptospira weilii serovar Topaz str. LT2116 TaxID=1088540 RepID=M3FNB4_9LEPT|nr:hypothetical protein LEP1GSC188_0748 [Leptospira weilii serovar Topaz str. LT2116]